MRRSFSWVFITVAALAAFSQGSSAQPTLDAAGSGFQTPQTIVGAWWVDVTPTFVPPFVSLGTFSGDGTLTNISSVSLSVPPESPGYGVMGQNGATQVCEHLLHSGGGWCREHRRHEQGPRDDDGQSGRRPHDWGLPGRCLRPRRNAHRERYRHGEGAPHQGGSAALALIGCGIGLGPGRLSRMKLAKRQPDRADTDDVAVTSRVGESRRRSATNVPFLLPRSSRVASSPVILISA